MSENISYSMSENISSSSSETNWFECCCIQQLFLMEPNVMGCRIYFFSQHLQVNALPKMIGRLR
jgi:hypothetical protein